ncbi:class I SAM-dependent methyltransferase [Labedella phragmitis]|nr:methyltransferase [Labedella phragmitis]
MPGDHYFTPSPDSEMGLRPLSVTLAGAPRKLQTGNGIFSPDRIDVGTAVLLSEVPAPPPGGDFLDIGCGWGPIALTLAIESPRATVWAVDVNERALELVRRNAESLGLSNVRAVLPDDVPDEVRFRTIWSNPPIRVGKSELHAILERWVPRLQPGSDGYLVVQRNLGSDSLHRWLDTSLPDGFSVLRAATGKGYRVLKVRRRPGASTESE